MEKMVKQVGNLQNMGESMQNVSRAKRNPHEAQKAFNKMQQ